MDRPPAVPPVVVVVVAREPGPWFEETLSSFGNQDYPNLSVLVIDAGSTVDPTTRVAAVLPDAYVRRMDGAVGYAAAANDVLETVQGAAFLLFCHDDVAPDPDAVRRLVEEAMRSNAGVVGPKLVDWDRPERLLDVGLVVDKTGAAASQVERGELDQEQHDAVRDVFAISGPCMLVRSDLFSVIGGFDPAMTDYRADVDLCWRAQIAGARVLVNPAARVRHREGGDEVPGADPRRATLDHRNHLRSMFKNYSGLHLVRVAPQAAVLTVGEIVLAVFGRRWSEARDLVAAWWWNLRHLVALRGPRKAVDRSRAVADSEVRRLQVRGSVRVTTYLQRRLHAEDRAQALVTAGQRLVGAVGRGPAQVATALLAVLVLAWLVGSRHLLNGRLPAVGELAPFPGPGTLLAEWVSGWRTTGLGAASPAPTAFALLGLSSFAFLGKALVLQKVLVLGAWLAGGAGVWRLTRPLDSTLARMVAVVAWLAVPVPYNALARGRWSGLVAYAVVPWLLSALLRATRLPPWAPSEAELVEGDHWRRRRAVLELGLALAVVVALAPPVALVLPVVAAAIVVGSLLVGGSGGAARGLGTVLAATAVAGVLLLPWSVELAWPGWTTLTGVPPDPAGAAGLGELLRFQVGPMGAAPLGWAFMVAAVLPLAIGRGWRFAWAARLWLAALTCVGLAWAGERGWVPLRLEAPDVLLAPAALAFVLAAALGAAAFDLDLPGYRFGWRQVASVAAGAAIVAGVLPVLGGARDGRWGLTDEETARALSWMEAEAPEGAFRVLWVGAAEALPLDGWPLGGGLAFATSGDGVPEATELWPGRRSEATARVADALVLVEAGDTARLGRLLAPMGIRYLVLPTAHGIAAGRGEEFPVPPGLTRSLGSQVDLRLLPADPALVVYENTAWAPVRALLPEWTGGSLPADLGSGADLSGATPVLLDGRANRYRGGIPAGGQVLVAEAPSARWSLRVGGQEAPRSAAFGVANAFRVAAPGSAVLRYRTPLLHYAMLAGQALLWLVAVRAVLGLRRRERRPGAAPPPAAPDRVPAAARS
jgi:GT2 family glycosyltransferase